MTSPVRHHEDRRDVEDLGPDLVEVVDDLHGGILPVHCLSAPAAGCPLVVAPAPASSPAGRLGRIAVVWLAGADRAIRRGPVADCRPTATPSRRASSRPSSQAEPAVRAPRSRDAVAQLAIVGDDQQRRRAIGASTPDARRSSPRMTASAVRGPL